MSEPELVLDCRTMLCPQPVIELAEHLGEVAVGEVVAVLVTDPAARYDIPAWCRMRGQEHLGAEPVADGATRHEVRRLG